MKKVLILGGRSDIGSKVVTIFLKMNWFVTAHYFKNQKQLIFLQKSYKNLKLTKCDFSKISNSNINNII